MVVNRTYSIILLLLLIFLTVGVVSANENITDDISLNDEISSQNVSETPITEEIESEGNDNIQDFQETTIEAKDVKTYYKEKSNFVAYLKDSNSNPIANKKIVISLDNKNYDEITDNLGKVVLKLNLNPGTYKAKISFAGDDAYAASSANAVVKVNKASLSIQTKDFKTYFESGFYFKAKVINKVTKKPVEGVKVAFKVYKNPLRKARI